MLKVRRVVITEVNAQEKRKTAAGDKDSEED